MVGIALVASTAVLGFQARSDLETTVSEQGKKIAALKHRLDTLEASRPGAPGTAEATLSARATALESELKKLDARVREVETKISYLSKGEQKKQEQEQSGGRLRFGMTMDEVRRIVGEPKRQSTHVSAEGRRLDFWFYDGFDMTFVNGRFTDYSERK